MESLRSDLVHIVRDFLVAHQSMRRVFARYREGRLSFEEVQELVGDSENHVLFRVKEHCHALFRESALRSQPGVRREALFDLAVGSLFHEAMKFRENFYQREIYAPRVASLRHEAGAEVDALFGEFEKILGGAEDRLGRSVRETEALLDQTARQLRLLLAGHRSNGLIARCLIEHRDLVDEVFSDGLEVLLSEIHGGVGAGYLAAAHSYLESASFERAQAALDEACKHFHARADLAALSLYAEGMQAFLAGRYEHSFELLGCWLDAGTGAVQPSYAALALAAVSRVGKLVEPQDAARLNEQGGALVRRLERSMRSVPPTSGDSGAGI